MKNFIKVFLLTIFAFAVVGAGMLALTQKTKANTVLQPTFISKPVAKTAQTTPQPAGGNTAKTTAVVVAKSQPTAAVPNCTPGSLPHPVAPVAASSNPGFHATSVSTSTYTLYGDTLDQLRSQMVACSPSFENGQHFAGSTNYSLSWTASISVLGNGLCTVNSASVNLAVAQVYPTWSASTNSAASLQSNWNSFITSLTTHENGHAAIDNTYAGNLYNHLQNVPATDCSSIDAKLEAIASADLNALNQANDAYDASTNHGATQGALL